MLALISNIAAVLEGINDTKLSCHKEIDVLVKVKSVTCSDVPLKEIRRL